MAQSFTLVRQLAWGQGCWYWVVRVDGAPGTVRLEYRTGDDGAGLWIRIRSLFVWVQCLAPAEFQLPADYEQARREILAYHRHVSGWDITEGPRDTRQTSTDHQV